jgi:hypothetical protein
MGTAGLFDEILRRELSIHAAWLPITNVFGIGDYGLMSDGVFVKMGNIREFGIDWVAEDAPPARVNFASEGTRMNRFVGNAKVEAFPDQDLDASFTIEFDRDSSFLVKAQLTVSQMQNLAVVANKLNANPDWRSRYRVVSAIHVGQQCTILSSKGVNSKIVLSGKASALKQLDLASASGEIGTSSSERIGLDLVGKSGVVGLSLFKLSWWSGGVKVLSTTARNDPSFNARTETSGWGRPDDDV